MSDIKNWTIRVGGEYPCFGSNPFGQYARVTSIHDGQVYFERWFRSDGTRCTLNPTCDTIIEAFRNCFLPEDQSPIPALIEALEEILTYTGGAENALQDPYVMERAHAALTKAKGDAQ